MRRPVRLERCWQPRSPTSRRVSDPFAALLRIAETREWAATVVTCAVAASGGGIGAPAIPQVKSSVSGPDRSGGALEGYRPNREQIVGVGLGRAHTVTGIGSAGHPADSRVKAALMSGGSNWGLLLDSDDYANAKVPLMFLGNDTGIALIGTTCSCTRWTSTDVRARSGRSDPRTHRGREPAVPHRSCG